MINFGQIFRVMFIAFQIAALVYALLRWLEIHKNWRSTTKRNELRAEENRFAKYRQPDDGGYVFLDGLNDEFVIKDFFAELSNREHFGSPLVGGLMDTNTIKDGSICEINLDHLNGSIVTGLIADATIRTD